MRGSRDGGGSSPIYRREGIEAKLIGTWGRLNLAGIRSAPRWQPEEAARRMAGGVANAQVARDVCRREERPRGHPGVLSGPPGSSSPRTRRGRGPPEAYGRAAAETEREMEIGTFL